MTPSLDDIQSDRMRSAGYDRQTIDRSLGQQGQATKAAKPTLDDPTAMRMAQRELQTTIRADAQAQREQNKQAAAASKLAAKQADPSYEPPEVTQARKIKNRMEEVERIKKRELKDFNSGAGSLITPDAKKKTGGELMNLEGYQTDAQDKTTGFLGIGGGSESDKAKAANQNINDLIAKAQRFDPSIKNADDLKRYRDTLSQQRDRITAEHDKIAGERQKWEKTYGDRVSQHYFPAGDGSVSAPAGATDRQPQSNESQAMPKTEDGRLSPDAIVRLTEMAKDHEHIAGMETTSDRLKQAVGVKAANLRKQAEDAVASYADRPDIQKQIVDATRDPTMSEKLKQGGLNVISAAETSLMDIPQFAVRQSNRLANAFGANINLDDNSAKNYMDAMQEVAKGHADGSDLPPAIKKKLDENWMVTDVARGVGSLAGMIGPGEVVGGLAELAKLGKVATAGEAAAAKAFGATAKNLTNLGAGSAATGNALRNEVIAANAPRMKAIDDQLAQQKITPAEHKQMANELQNQAGKAEALGSVLGLGLGAIGPLAESIGGMMQVPAGKAFAKVFMQTAAKDAKGLTKFMQGPGRVLLDKTINSLGEGGSMAVINALTRMGENLAAQGSIPGMEGWDKSRGVMTGVDESSISGLITGTLLRGVREAATRNGMTLPVPEIGKDGKPVDPLAGKTINDLRDVVKTEDEFKTGEKPPEEPPAGAPVTPKPPDIPPTDAGLHPAVDTTGVTTPFDDALKPRTPEQIPMDTGLNTAVDTENVSTPFDEAVKRAKETPADVPSGQSVSEPSNEAAPAPLPPAVETAQGQSVIRDNLQKPTAPSAAVETSTPESVQKAEVLGVKPAAEVQASAPVSKERIREDLPEAKPILDEINAISDKANALHDAMAEGQTKNLTNPIDLLSTEEKTRLHELQNQLRPKSQAEAKADRDAKREAKKKTDTAAALAKFDATKESAKVEPAEPQKLGGKDIATRITNAEEKFISFARETAGLTRMQAIRALGEYKKSKAIKIDMNGGQYSFTDGRFAEADVLRRAAGESEAAKQPTSRPVESESDKAQAKKPTTPEPAPSAVKSSGKPAEAAKPAAKVEPVESAQGGKNETIKVINPYGLAPEGEKILTVSGKTIKLKAAPDLDFFAYKTSKNGYWTVVEKNTGSGLGGIAEKTRDAAIAKAEEKISQVGSKRMNELVAETAWLNKSKDAVESAPAEQPNAFAKVSDKELRSEIAGFKNKLNDPHITDGKKQQFQLNIENRESELGRRAARKAEAGGGKGKRIGYGPRKEGEDILDHIKQLGGIPRPPEGVDAGSRGEWNGYKELANNPKARLLIGKGRGGIDTWMDELNALGNHKVSTLGELHDRIESALRSRDKEAETSAKNENQGKIADVLLKNEGRTKKADDPRYLSDVGKGDTFTANGEPFKVTDVKQDGTIVAQDGPKYGKIELPPDGKFFPDKGSFQKVPPTLENPVVAKVNPTTLRTQADTSLAGKTPRELLGMAKPFSEYGQNYSRNIAASAERLKQEVDRAAPVEVKKPVVATGANQTVDMFDSGKANEDFALAGESAKDFTGNMDAKAKLAADKAEAEAAQGRLFGEDSPKVDPKVVLENAKDSAKALAEDAGMKATDGNPAGEEASKPDEKPTQKQIEDADFKSEKEARDAHEKEGLKKHNETLDEFLKRRDCQNPFLP